MPDVSYVPGPLTAVAGDQCWALVAASPASLAVTRIWQQLGQGGTGETLLSGFLADGLSGTPGFALLIAEADGQHRLFCRGAVGATLVTSAAAGDFPPGDTGAGGGQAALERIDGAGLLTWREHVVDNAERVFLGEPPADTALRLPATSGVLLAACMVIDFTNSATRQTVEYPPEMPKDLPKKTTPFFPGTVTVPPRDGDVSQARPGGQERATAPPVPVAQAPAGPDDGHGDEGEYDFLWGATQMRAVEDAAIREPGDGGPLPPGQYPPGGRPMGSGPWSGGLPSLPPAAMPPEPSLPMPLSAPPGGLIDVPQWLAGPGEPTSTIKRGDLPEPVGMTAPPDRIGPVVPALICPNDHVNPPSGAACRKCGAPLPHDPVPVPRPVLGVLRLSVGDVITLDRDVIMGRNPRTDFAGADGAERPHVVKLPAAGGDVSRTHLRVSLDGWHVLVTDLNSTNGTLVTLPGRDPLQLRPGEPVPIQPGTIVTIAEDIDFRYEVTD